MQTKFLIVDGNSIAFRAVAAHNPHQGPDLRNSSGKLTGGTYRFLSMFDRLLHQVKPTHAVIGWDVSQKTFRNEIDSTYKANRERKNDDFYSQYSDIKDILKTVGFKNAAIKGFEGDDIVGTYVNISKADMNYIISGDKDNFQLVNDKTVVIFPKNGFKEIELITPKYIFDKYGISVENFIDLKALIGDSGDNIKGIGGCGEKTAAKLIQHYGNIDNIAKNASNIDLKGINKTVKENILEWVPRYDTVRQLVTIRKDVPVPYDFDDCKLELNWENARPIFRELEFSSLIKKINGGDFYNVTQ